MKRPNREEQRQLVRQWEETGRELERLRWEQLRDKPFDWKEVDALLSLGENVPHEERWGGGLAEIQRHFLKADPRRKGREE